MSTLHFSSTIGADSKPVSCFGHASPAVIDRATWRSRGYVPHLDSEQLSQSITFRLAGSVPADRLRDWSFQAARHNASKAKQVLRRQIEKYLDCGYGEPLLSRADIAQAVQDTLLKFDDELYYLHAWAIMPNHVHVLITPREGNSIARIMHSWKSFTASEANRLLKRHGIFWQREYFDRYIRNRVHFAIAVEYIENNPVKAGLCKTPADWPFSSGSF